MSVLRSLFRRQLLSEDFRAGSSVSPALERCATAGEPLPGDEPSTSSSMPSGPPLALSLSPAPSTASSSCSDPGSPLASPTASQAAAAAAAAAEQGQQQPRRRQLRVNGMDAYDYWSLIKSL